MSKTIPHRKRIRHFHEPGDFHELTFSCYKRMPLLTNDLWRRLLAESIDEAADARQFHLNAFVFMPEHAKAGEECHRLAVVERPLQFATSGPI